MLQGLLSSGATKTAKNLTYLHYPRAPNPWELPHLSQESGRDTPWGRGPEKAKPGLIVGEISVTSPLLVQSWVNYIKRLVPQERKQKTEINERTGKPDKIKKQKYKTLY